MWNLAPAFDDLLEEIQPEIDIMDIVLYPVNGQIMKCWILPLDLILRDLLV